MSTSDTEMDDGSIAYVCAVMRKLGMIKVSIEYDGGGDSGDVSDITWQGMSDLEKVPYSEDLVTIRYRGVNGETLEPACLYTFHLHDKPTMATWLRYWFHDSSECFLTYDWVNNDGGGGTFHIIPQENRAENDGYYRETVSTAVADKFEADKFDILITEEVSNG